MSISFEKSTYLSLINRNKDFESEKKIFDYAKEHPKFSYGKVEYKDFAEKYSTDCWFGRKVVALPRAIWSGVVKTLFHLAMGIFIGAPKACSDKGRYLQASLFYVARDLQESLGWLASLFNDRYGQYHVQESHFQKSCYDCFSTDRQLDLELAKNSADYFIKKIEESDEIDYSLVEDLRTTNDVSHFILPTFNPIKKEKPRFEIYDKQISSDKILDLLICAYKKGIVLSLFSLKRPITSDFDAVGHYWAHAGVEGKQVEEVIQSFNISAPFIKKCLDEDIVDVERMNKQLSALSVTYFRGPAVQKAVLPSLYLEDASTIWVSSTCGEIGDLDYLISQLDREGITIKLFGSGFRLWNRGSAYGEDESMSGYIQSHKFKATIEDCTNIECSNEDIWQENSPPQRWNPTFSEMQDEAKKKLSVI